ncbi:hypothetical protein NKG94_30500 [Micromonospora sp. M12]
MTATADAEAAANELTPLADYLGSVLRRLRALPPLDLDLTQAHGNVLAEDVVAPHAFPAFDQAAVDGYAARWEDISGGPGPELRPGPPAHRRPDHPAQRGRRSRRRELAAGPAHSRFVLLGGRRAPLPVAADVVVPVEWTDQGMAAVEIFRTPNGVRVRRAGEELPVGTLLAQAGTYVSPALVAVFAATGIGHVVVRPSPRVVIVATGDELVDVGRGSQPGQVVDANSHALTAAAAEVGALAYRVGICDDDPEGCAGCWRTRRCAPT